MGKDIDMTPSDPGRGRNKAHEQALEAARLVCKECSINEVCYVYSRDVDAPPVYAAGLEDTDKTRLNKIMNSSDALSSFVAAQVFIQKQKEPSC